MKRIIRKTKKIKNRKKNRITKINKYYGGNQNIELIMKSHRAGFFSHFNNLLVFLVDNPNITKITYDVRSHKNGPIAYIKENEELFSKIFESYDQGKPINRTISSIRDDFNTLYLSGKEVPSKYYGVNRNNLQPFHDAYKKYIKIKHHIQHKIDNKVSILKKDAEQIIGIFIRSDALAYEQPNGKMPRREDYDNALSKLDLTKKTKYFLCIDNEDDLNYFKNKYTPNYYTDIRRTSNKTNGEPHTNLFGSLKDLEDSFIEVALMSQCDILLHCSSNMATASLYMNMNQQSIFVEYND